LAGAEQWDRHEKNLQQVANAEKTRDALKNDYSAAVYDMKKLVAAAQPELNGVADRIEKNPNPTFKAAGIARARADPELRRLADAAKGDPKEPTYHNEAKRLVYNEVRRLERDHLTKLADDLSNYDCWSEAAELEKKLLAAVSSPVLADVKASLGDGGLGTVGAIPDLYAFPWNEGAATQPGEAQTAGGKMKPAAGPVWVRQKPEIQAGANAKTSGSGAVVTSEKDGKKYTANVNWSEPPAELHEGEDVTLTMSASGAMPGYALGWFNIGCAGDYKTKDNNAASWPEGKRTGKAYNNGTMAFKFAPGGDPYIQVQAGQEPGTSRWTTVTWRYKRKE
jgi:hypothetical protein